jgi:arginyl-tRNA synthetase
MTTDTSGEHDPSENGHAALEQLRAAVLGAASELGAAGEPAGHPGGERGGDAPAREGRAGADSMTLERPKRAEFGDYSTNAALLLAPVLGAPPREVAERLGAALAARLGQSLDRFEVAGPGFLNLFLTDGWLTASLAGALAAGERYGAGGAVAERVLVEFVSANPTGPMHVGHARNAAYGDALARLLAFRGHRVEREFYVNDAGSQVVKLGESIQALARGEPVPEDGYHGDYVGELVEAIPEAAADGSAAAVGHAAVAIMLDRVRESLQAFGVAGFDHWSYESSLHEGSPSPVEHTLAMLQEGGHAYRGEGALWLRTTDFGDDKDRVLVRSNGEHTYFASDIAYHEDKRERGYERQINVWGADHHGYVLRMKAAYEALGGDPDELELLIMQLVHLVRSGERSQMSKRAGSFVTLEELVEMIGVDAARWYLLARSHDTTVDLDIDLARTQSNENPVYYVQYAHARIASMLQKAGVERARRAGDPGGWSRAPLHPAERELILQLLAFPEEAAVAADRRAPHRLAAYALALAQTFTAFYRDCRVVGAGEEPLESLRLALSLVARDTIARSLALLGVSAPQEM